MTDDVEDLEREKNRYVCELDILSQQQTELETGIIALEKSLGLSEHTDGGGLALAGAAPATSSDLQRRSMWVHFKALKQILSQGNSSLDFIIPEEFNIILYDIRLAFVQNCVL